MTPRGDVNGADCQTELNHWVYRRCRDGPEHRLCAQSSHAKLLKKNNQRAVLVATGAPGRAPLLIRPRLAHARTTHQGTWKVTYTGTGP